MPDEIWLNSFSLIRADDRIYKKKNVTINNVKWKFRFRWNFNNVEKKMSARSQRGNHDTSASKRLHSPRVNPKNRGPRPHITYDYDAAISQPDVPSLIDYKKLGRGAMVSGVLLKKRNLKKRIKPRKNFQKRSQESKMKSLAQKKGIRLPGSKTGNPANKTVGSSNNFDKDHVDIKEDIINDTIDDLSNILKVRTFSSFSLKFHEFAKFIIYISYISLF